MVSSFRLVAVVGLWMLLAAIASQTALTIIASRNPVNCPSLLTPGSPDGQCPLLSSIVPGLIRRRTALFQSLHAFLLQAIVSVALFVFVPRLLAMTWASLENGGMTVLALQGSSVLSASPGLVSSLMHVFTSRRLAWPTFFVLALAVIRTFSSFIVAPIYVGDSGSQRFLTTYTYGGGVGPRTSQFFDYTSLIPGAAGFARTIVNSNSLANATWNGTTSPLNILPFLYDNDVRRTAQGRIQTVAAYNTLDCSQAAVARISNGTRPPVAVTDDLWTDNGASYVTVLNTLVGAVTAQSILAMTYANATTTQRPGLVEAVASVIFMFPNATIEGSQITLRPRNSTLPNFGVDVLVCTSTSTLAISNCVIEQATSSNMSSAANCTPVPFAGLPPYFTSQNPVGVGTMLNGAENTAALLAGGPVWTTSWLPSLMPAYDNVSYAQSVGQLPYSYTTGGLPPLATPVTVSQAYIRDVIFPATQHALVQGFVNAWPQTTSAFTSLVVSYSTSHPGLQIAILVFSFLCAAVTTLTAIAPRRVRSVPPFSVGRLLAISRNDALNDAFEPYANRHVQIPASLDNVHLSYGHVEHIARYALVARNTRRSGRTDSIPLLRRWSDFSTKSTNKHSVTQEEAVDGTDEIVREIP